MITPTCQVCGTTLDLEGGVAIETVIRRGSDDSDMDLSEFWGWKQELQFQFCGEEHMKSWMTAYALPAYEPPSSDKSSSSVFEGLATVALVALLVLVLTGAVSGFLLMLERIF